MNNEFYEHKKSDAVKWIIVFVLIGVLFAGMIASLVMSAPDKIEETEGGVNVEAAAGDFEATMHNTEFISLKMSAQAVTAADNSVSKTLTATVTPDDANDKSVDWSIAWMSGATRAEEAVTDYVTVTPESDGALVATVTCHKAFPGDKAVITVKTRAGGFTADCVVEFKGVPESLTIDTATYENITDSSWGVQLIEIGCGSTAYFDLDLDNVFGSVGAEYNDFDITLEAHGSIEVNVETYDSTGNHTGSNTQIYELKIADLMDQYDYCYSYFDKSGSLHPHVDARIENGRLKIDARDAISAYSATAAGRGGRAEYTFKDYVDGKIPYVTVTVTEKTSGASCSVNIRTVPTVENIALSSETLVF